MKGFAKGREARMTNGNTRGREARRNDERLYFKFMVKYFEALHPDIFAKATNLHNETKKLNPNVKDLTKTVTFMTTVTPNIPVPRYYYNRLLKMDTVQQLQNGPRMVLQIPLQNLQTSPSVTTHTPSPPVPVPSPPAPVPLQPSQSAPLLMSENMYNQILAEIQADPDTAQIFRDFHLSNDGDDDDDDMNAQPVPQQTPNLSNDGDDDDDDMNPFVWDDISPRENILSNIF